MLKPITPKIKKLLIIFSILFTLLSVVLLSGYLLIKSYIHKMNLVKPQTQTEWNSMQQAEWDGLVNQETEDYDITANTPSQETDDSKTKVEDNREFGTQSILKTDTEVEEAPTQPDSQEEEIKSLEDKIHKNIQDDTTPIAEDKKVTNILLIGSDTRSTSDRGRSDAMILISINKKKKQIIATSIMRDIYLSIPGREKNRINTAYAYGGPDLLLKTIEQNFKLKVDRYAIVDFAGFTDVVDAIGGVELEIKKYEFKHIEGDMRQVDADTGEITVVDAGAHKEPGNYLLNGAQALDFARIRYSGNADFERTSRQRRVLEQLFLSVKDLKLKKINELLEAILPLITTNLTEEEIFSLILSIPTVSGYELKQSRIPVDGSYTNLRIRGMAVLGIDFEENVKELYDTIYAESK